MDRETAKAINNLSKKINEIDAKLDRYFNARCDENADNIEMTEETVSSVMEIIIPEQAESIEEVAATVDIIMTEIIPGLME